MKIILILFTSIYSSLVDYDFTNSVGQVVLDTSGNDNHAVLGGTLLEEASDPILTDRGAYFTSTTYIQLPPNSLLPLNSVALTNFYGVMFVYIITSGTMFTVTASSSVKLKVQHSGSTITFYQYVLLSGSASDSLALGNNYLDTWSAVLIGYNFLSVGSCISTSLSIKVSTESYSLSGLALSSTYNIQLGTFSSLPGFTGFISEFHLFNPIECTTAYATHAGATFPSSYSSPYTSGTGESCSCGSYSCTGSPLACIQCDTSCEYYCESSSVCIDIIDICKPFAIINGVCDTSALYINHCKTQQSSLICSSCDTGYYLSADQSTCCQLGYYFVSSQNCLICDSSCATCSGAGTASCLTCVDSHASSISGTCTCNTYYFYNALTGICDSCLADCSTCNSVSTCLTCKDANAVLDSNSLCICPNGFYDDPGTTALDCLSCHSSCATCSGAGSASCLSCIDSHATSISGTCTCNTYYFYNALAGICDSCLADCLTCNSVSTCLTCKDANAVLDSNSLCICPNYFYDDPGTTALDCINCHSSCTTCSGTSSASCLTCIDPHASSISGTCTCNTYYFYNALTLACDSCLLDCSTCNSISTCLTCKDANAILDSNSLCICPNGFYDDPGTSALDCLSCHSSCATCSGAGSASCLTCIDPHASSISGSCICNSNYFYNSLSSICENCHSDCLFCIDSTINACTQCTDINSELLVNPGACTCKIGFVSTSSSPLVCSSCHSSCSACTGVLVHQCTSCSDPLASLNLGVCECQIGLYFDANWQCVNCFVDCNSCVGSGNSLCTSCSDINAVIDTVPGICQCLPGYVAVGQNPLICSPCFIDCATCDGLSLTECTSCANLDAVLDNGKCVCGPGFSLTTLNPLTCTACNNLCKLCSGPSETECLDCKDPFALVLNGRCQCQSSYYYNDTTSICEKCQNYCFTCQSSYSCDQCETGYFLNNSQCIECHISCETCIGEYFKDCTSCKDSSITPSTVPGPCRCKSNEYINTLSPLSCISCNENCIKCLESECLECDQGYSPQGVNCIRNELVLNITVYSNLSLLFLFSEPLSTELQSSDFKSKIDSKALDFKLTQQNSSAYGIELGNIDFTTDKVKVSISFVKNITSSYNSLLKQTQFTCYLENPYTKTVHTPYIIEVSVSTLSKTLVFAGISSIFIRNKNGSVWISLNTIQMLSYIPLFDIEIPDILKFFLMGVRPISILPNPFTVLTKITCSTPEIPQNFRDYGFTCRSFLLNSGELLLFFIIGLSFSVFFLILYYLPNKTFKLFIIKKLNNYKYSYFIRFWIQGYTDIALNTAVSLNYLTAENKFEEADSTFTVFSAILLSLSPIAIIIFYIKNKELIKQKDLRLMRIYSPLFKDFQLSSPFNFFLPLFFVFRLTFVAILFNLKYHPAWQIGISCFMQVINLFLMVKLKVLRIKWEYWLYLLEESLIFIVFLMVGLFLFDFSKTGLSYICYSIIIIVVLAIFTGFIVSMCELIYELKRKCKKRTFKIGPSEIAHVANEKPEATHGKYIDNQNLDISKDSYNATPNNSISNYPSTTVIGDKLTIIKKSRRELSFIYQRINHSN